ncbi:hypothetical protein DXG03_005239, partial [Asterophora parasitica]
DFDAFCEAFEAHFGNPNIAGDANDKLLTLVQTGSAAAHASQYTELLIHVDWSEQMKIDNFYHSLKSSVKDAIMLTCLQDCPKVFKKYVDFVIKIDNHGIPMEIDAMCTIKPHGPLTDKEKDHCHHLGLCSYCSGTGHMAAACPNMSAASKKHFTDRKASSQQGKA